MPVVNETPVTRLLTPLEQALETVNSAPFDVWLTGSRYFGTAHAGSDWDYFCEDSPASRFYFETNNFVRNVRSIYLEDIVKGINTKQEIAAVFEAVDGRVQVQLVKQPLLKSQIQLYIKLNPHLVYRLKQNKESAKSVWETLFTIVTNYPEFLKTIIQEKAS